MFVTLARIDESARDSQLRMTVSADLYAHWCNLEAEFRWFAPVGASFIAFLCYCLWSTWLPYLAAWDDKWKRIYRRRYVWDARNLANSSQSWLRHAAPFFSCSARLSFQGGELDFCLRRSISNRGMPHVRLTEVTKHVRMLMNRVPAMADEIAEEIRELRAIRRKLSEAG